MMQRLHGMRPKRNADIRCFCIVASADESASPRMHVHRAGIGMSSVTGIKDGIRKEGLTPLNYICRESAGLWKNSRTFWFAHCG